MMTSERHLKLMAYADGELDESERAEVESWLATDADAVRFVNDLAVLGDYVTLGRPEPQVDLADAIMAKVEMAATAKVVPLQPRRGRGLAIGGGIAAALALAASVFLFTRPHDEEPLAGGGSIPTAAPAGTGVDVDLAEAPGESLGVFYNETSHATTSVTVWVDEPTGAK